MQQTDPNLLLTKALVATFFNSKLENKDNYLDAAVTEVIEEIAPQAAGAGAGSIGDIYNRLKQTLEMISRTRGEIDAQDILARMKVDCRADIEYYEVARDLMVLPDTQEGIQKRVTSMTNEFTYELQTQRIASKFRTAYKKVSFGEGDLDIRAFATIFSEEMQELSNSTIDVNHEGLHGSLSTDDPESVEGVFEKSKILVSMEGVLRTGFRGLNDCLGVGGLQAGFTYCFPALSHNYKTGILLDLGRQVPMYNVPHVQEGKKGLVYRISFENNLEQDLPVMYRSIWEAENKKKLHLKEIDAKVATDYIIEKLTANNWAFIMECYDPNNFSVRDLVTRLNYLASQGYEVKLCIVDYLEMIARADNRNRKDQAITNTFEYLRNHCFPRGITVVTAHQLSTEAQKLAREGTAGLAAKLASGGYYQNCQSLHTKLDCEVVMHIHKQGEDSYLTFARGKHRGGEQTPVKHRTFAYKFQVYGGLVDDVLDEQSSALYSIPGMSGVTASPNGDNLAW